MEGFLALAACGFILWLLYRGLKGNKEAFSRENLGKSFTTMGILALLLICGVGFVIILLKRA